LKGSYFIKALKSPIYPQSTTITGTLGLSFLSLDTFEIYLTTSIPSIHCPKTTCLSSRCGHGLRVIKNWLEFVFLPQFAIDNNPAHECFLVKL